MATKGLQVNRSELSRIYGVAPTTVDSWISRGCPSKKTAKGWSFNTARVSKWLLDEAVSNVARSIADIDIEEAKRRKIAAEAALAELDYTQKKGELLPTEAVRKEMFDSYSACKARFLAIPQKISPQVAAISDVQKCRKLIETEIYSALNELGEYDPGSADDPEY